ncbi:phosphodiester glycosidase family protein [Luteococcus sp. H138]|uniref:phosphodiester glycosidase family protein n=1 Tax=unclassified Luteococcus TaxID=2639923 RepID=UPI00313EACDC
MRTHPTLTSIRSAKGLAVAVIGTTALTLPLAVPANASAQHPVPQQAVANKQPAPKPAPELNLGSPDQAETRTSTRVQRGVTHTLITRGSTDPSLRWVVEVSMPSLASSPDPKGPARSVQDKAAAEAQRARIEAAGFPASIEPVRQPEVADLGASTLGYRLRLDQRPTTQAEADKLVAALKAKGFAGRSWYTGWDGDVAAKGPWRIHVLTIDPQTFTGRLGATYGPDLAERETTTELAGYTRAKAMINAGFFVMDPTAGAEGDPAGAGVYNGNLVSETITGRPALVLHPDARRTRVVQPVWKGEVTIGRQRLQLDGVNRVIGLIRNCGGDVTDSPTSLPLHDATCQDEAEAVAYTRAFAHRTPKGEGAELVLRRGKVIAVKAQRGTLLGRGQSSVQFTGRQAQRVLASARVGQRADVKQYLTDGRKRLDRKGTTVVNGGPELVRSGQLHVTQKRDGMSQATNPSFDYGWVLQRNPRTFAGTDAKGRTLLVTVDGRQLTSLGLSIPEAAQVAKDLGMVNAINLDGGGSTAMVLNGQLVTSPSDSTGERPVGDAIFVR